MLSARSFAASGEGSSFFRFSIAFSTMPFGSPSLPARSNNSVGTPALARCAAICAPMTPAPRTAALRTRNRVSDIRLSMGCKKNRRSGAAARTVLAVRSQRSLGRVGQLKADDVHVAPVRAADQAVGGRAPLVLIDAGVANPNVGIGEIDRQARRELVLHAQREPGAVLVRQPRRALRIANGGLIVSNASTEDPR